MRAATLLSLLAVVLSVSCDTPPELSNSDANRKDLGAALPPGFLFGTATASHQIEGANSEIRSDWRSWELEDLPDGGGRIADGSNADVAAGSWNDDFKADLAAMRELGVNSYRFSVDWARLEPAPGQFDEAAFARYRAFTARLRAVGIEPMVTVHHFVSPQWLADKGGFENRDAIEDLTAFAAKVGAELGHEVDLWGTINEPNVYAFLGYVDGSFPPGKQSAGIGAGVLANLLEAHARMYAALKASDTFSASAGAPPASVGLVHHVRTIQPASNSTADVAIAAATDDYFNESTVRALATGRIHIVVPGEIEIDREVDGLKGSCDWLGLNYYTRYYARVDVASPSRSQLYFEESRPHNELGWEIYPEGLYQFLRRFSSLGVPLYVTENGMADPDGEGAADYLRKHVLAVERAAQDGVDVRGYFYWSLMDNFEWADGYRAHFGLYRIGGITGTERTPKQAAVETFQNIARNVPVR